MGKKPSLAAALQAASKKPAPPAPAVVLTEISNPTEMKSVSAKRPDRANTKAVVGYFDPAVSRQLKQLALDQDSTIQKLLQEALNDFFEKHRQKPIA